MKSRIAYGLIAVALFFAAPLAAQSESADSLALGRKYTMWFYDGEADSLWAIMDSASKGRVGSQEAIENMMDQLYEQLGEEVAVVSETASLGEDGVLEYRRLAEFDTAPERVVWIWRIGEDGQIVGASIRPESQAPPVD